MLFLVQPARAQSCGPLPITILGVPYTTELYYANVVKDNVTLQYNGASVVFTVDSAWQGRSQWVGPAGRVGFQNVEYLQAEFGFDPLKTYRVYIEVLDASITGNLHETFSRISVISGLYLLETGTTYWMEFSGNQVPSKWDELYLQVSSTTPGAAIAISGTWRITLIEAGCTWPPEEEPPPPPPSEFCPDGYELLEEVVSLSSGTPWYATMETSIPRLKVRYTFSDTMQGGSRLHYLDMRVNDTRVTRRFYTDEMQDWDPVTGWPDSAFSFMVPNTNEPRQPGYDPGGYETGPDVLLYVAEGYNPINLLSVCVIPVPTSEFCEDGIEALTATPIYLSAAGGMWQRTLDAAELGDLTHFVVRYRVSHPDWPGTGGPGTYEEILGKFQPQIQANFFYVESPITYGITFTLPMSGAFSLVDDELFLRFYNRNDAVLLNSVCIIDAAEDYLNDLTAADCHLNNPDFVTPPSSATDWHTEGSVTHMPLIGPNGGVAIAAGKVYQNPVIDVPNIWQMEVRALGGAGASLTFGTQRGSILDGQQQMKTEELSPSYRLYRNNIYVTQQDWVAVQSDDAAVDYVCLMKRTGIIDMPDCDPTKPVWNPTESGDPLLIYLFKYIGDMIEWGVCLIVRILTALVNYGVIAIEDVLLRLGPLPNPFGGNFWEELMLFLRLSLEGLQDYLRHVYWGKLFDWLRDVINQLARWISWQWRRVGQWLNWLLYDIVQWLANQFGVPPQDIYDALYNIGYEARMFWFEMQEEIFTELSNVLLLLTNLANVLITLASGVREGVSGNTIAYIGTDFQGVGAFIWDGVAFVNEAVDLTPLSALNIVALGIISIGLMQWTGKRFLRMLEAFS